MPLHSAHLPKTSGGIIFSLLKTHYSHSSNKINDTSQVSKLLNDLLERGHNQEKALDMLKEELKLMEMKKRRSNSKNVAYENH